MHNYVFEFYTGGSGKHLIYPLPSFNVCAYTCLYLNIISITYKQLFLTQN